MIEAEGFAGQLRTHSKLDFASKRQVPSKNSLRQFDAVEHILEEAWCQVRCLQVLLNSLVDITHRLYLEADLLKASQFQLAPQTSANLLCYGATSFERGQSSEVGVYLSYSIHAWLATKGSDAAEHAPCLEKCA